MPTRVVHRVRCRKKDNKQVWADVKVVDALSVAGTDGKEKLVYVRTKASTPYIVDKTTGKNGKGDPKSASRTSHMVLAESAEDPNQKMYLEILDTLAIVNVTPRSRKDQAGAFADIDRRYGSKDAALDGAGEITLVFPESRATKFVFDKTGLDLTSGSSNNASRAGHVSLVTEKGNTDDKTDGVRDNNDSVPPKKLDWCAVLKPDALHVSVTGQQVITLFIPKGAQDELDTTQETTDPLTGLPCPPDNTDPHVYVAFPLDGVDDPNAPCVGCNVHIPVINGQQKPIDQGPLWWIEKISPGFRPWFWYADINTPKAFSFFGSPGRLGNWAWRGFVLWNNYPVIWILASNLPIQPMGQFGSPSLELCARIGSWDFGFPPVPSASFSMPGRTDPNTASAAPTQLELLAGIVAGGDIANANDAGEGIGKTEPGPFGPFGILQMTHPPLGPLPDAVPYGPVNPGSEIFDGRPNIWQLTGKQQPPRADVTKQWDPFNNPYTPPSAKDAEAAARAFETNWNAVANGHNEFIEGFVPGGGVSNGAAGYTQPPGWNWAIPWFDGSTGPPTDFRASFQNGIPPGVATKFFPLEIYAPATAWTLKVDQLRADWWDTTHLEFFNNPLNAFFPIVLPPFLWSNDPWIGTNSPAHDNPITGP